MQHFSSFFNKKDQTFNFCVCFFIQFNNRNEKILDFTTIFLEKHNFSNTKPTFWLLFSTIHYFSSSNM
jgi:hypothetical protein